MGVGVVMIFSEGCVCLDEAEEAEEEKEEEEEEEEGRGRALEGGVREEETEEAELSCLDVGRGKEVDSSGVGEGEFDSGLYGGKG